MIHLQLALLDMIAAAQTKCYHHFLSVITLNLCHFKDLRLILAKTLFMSIHQVYLITLCNRGKYHLYYCSNNNLYSVNSTSQGQSCYLFCFLSNKAIKKLKHNLHPTKLRMYMLLLNKSLKIQSIKMYSQVAVKKISVFKAIYL